MGAIRPYAQSGILRQCPTGLMQDGNAARRPGACRQNRIAGAWIFQESRFAPRRRVRLLPARGAPRPARPYGSIAHGKRAAGRARAGRSTAFGLNLPCRRFCGGPNMRMNRGGAADARVLVCALARVWQSRSAGPGHCRLFRYAHLRRGRRRRQVPPRRPSMAHRGRPKLDRPLSGQ